MYKLLTTIFLFLPFILFSEEFFQEAKHEGVFFDQKLSYSAISGSLPEKNQEGEEIASLFFVYYRANDEKSAPRPVTFCFNGGPGSSSVWLHLGVLGPKVIEIDETRHIAPPYSLIPNDLSLLASTDLVFIDPVGTGFSQVKGSGSLDQFHGVSEDARSIASFIRLFLTRFGRWNDPKFLIGESYGSTRVALLAEVLKENHRIDVEGLVFVSTVLNFQTILDPSGGNDLPYLLFLPSFAYVANSHGLINEEPKTLMKDVIAFIKGPYQEALFKGDLLDGDQRANIAKKLSRFTGLSEDYCLKANLRISQPLFSKELLREEGLVVGRMNGLVQGKSFALLSDEAEHDPSLSKVLPPFTALFNTYLKSDLNIEKDQEYIVLNSLPSWKWGQGRSFLNVADNLARVLAQNTNMRLFVASGKGDLATPFYGTFYTLTHLGLPFDVSSRIVFKDYDGGHMMYLDPRVRKALLSDLNAFFTDSLQK